MSPVAKYVGIGVAALVVVAVAVVVLTPRPDCSIDAVGAPEKDIFMVKGDPDFGYHVDVTVKNKGKRGNIAVVTRLGTSDGDFSRVRTQIFEENEQRVLRAEFPEPTLTTSDVKSYGSCTNA